MAARLSQIVSLGVAVMVAIMVALMWAAVGWVSLAGSALALFVACLLAVWRAYSFEER